MAATQAEPQQNDVNRDIVHQDQPQISLNNSFQNGTDNGNCRGVIGTDVVGSKGKKPVQSNISVDMSQYRQDTGPSINNSEQNVNSSEDSGGKINNSDKSFPHNSEQSASEVNFGKGPPDGQNMQGYGLSFPPRGNYMHPEAGNPMHLPGGDSMHHQTNSYGHFNPNMRHSYPGAKPLPVPTRPPSGGPISSGGFPPHSQQQRFITGQSISPPTGPTPTLNQLLQSSNSVHRYQNSYGDYAMAKTSEQPQGTMPYNQNWPPPRGPMGPYPPQQPGPGYRNQPSSATSRGYAGSPGGGPYPPPPAASPSQQYPPQSYRHPYQIGGPPANNGSSFGGGPGPESRGSSWSPGPQGAAPQPQQEPPSPSTHPHQSYPPTQRGSDQSPTTNAHAPEPGDLTGQNSNDSSSGGGPAPGTPNSGGMRPTPSPTGSTGSRSMSPAVGGQQTISMPPRPSSGQSDSGNGPTRMSHSPMATQGGGYPGQGPGGGVAPPHMHNYKMSPHQLPHPPQSQQVPPYSQPQQHPQYPQQGSYGVRGAAPGMGPAAMGYGSSYGGQGPPPQSQYPPPRPIPNHVQYPPSPYQHKVVSYSSNMPPSPGSYNSHGGGAMGPPPPHHPGMPPPPPPTSTPTHDIHEPSITTTPPGPSMTSVSQSGGGGSGGGGSVTSIVTTGPDGTPLDEASQQSTLSNASAASGDDGNITPSKRVKDNVTGIMGYHSHPTTPQSTAPSPGGASLNSMHEEYPPDHSPTWPRTPASPVFNSHIPQDLYRPKKQHDSLGKLYEMDESHDRRMWLDKLLHFMEERGTPISACPTISKNPLDLFRLYLFVKERGGFMEVTKNKIWKDIAGLLGIGASSSAAYTLRKHYTKNLLPFECHFDRGGIDPQPIINQVEATSKKKGAKGTAPVPSPGSSNSQDSFQGPGSGGTSMDGYSNYGGYPQDYNSQQQRPPSQSSQGMVAGQDNISVSNPFDDNATSSSRGGPSRPGLAPSGGGYQGQGSGYQYGEGYSQQYPGAQYPPNRPMYPPYGPEGDRGYNQSSSSANSTVPPPPGPGSGNSSQGPGPQAPQQGQQQQPQSQQQQQPQQQDYNRYPIGGGYPPPRGYPPPGGGASPSGGTPPGGQYSGDFYREGYYPPGAGGAKAMPPPAPQPRRHPDFVKDAAPQPPYPPYPQQRPNMYPGWSNNSSNNFRGQYPTPGGSPGPQQWGQGPSRPGAPPNHQSNSPQWQPPYQPSQAQQGWGMGTPGVNQNSPLRPPMAPRPGFRPDSKQYCQMPPHPGVKAPGMGPGFGPGSSAPVKRELVFPLDSVEATTPVLYKRRRLAKTDVAPLEAWRIMMALKSGLLAETTWALDVLNILLFDDSTIAYFGLAHLPGLMDILLEHMKRALSDMLEPQEIKSDDQPVKPEDLGAVISPPVPEDRVTFLKNGDYTYRSRKGHTVTITQDTDDIFVLDGKRTWDSDDIVDDGDQDSRYIISCFRAEFGKIPFFRMLSGPNKEKKIEVKEEPRSESPPPPVIEEKKPEKKVERVTRKKTKSLSDVLSRIKKEVPPETVEEPVKPPDIKEEVKEEPVSSQPSTEESPPVDIPIKEEVKEEDKPLSRIRDPAGTLKRRRISDYEDECYTRDEASLYLVTETQDAIARRCVCISTILRNLTFVPGNEIEFAKSGTFLGLLGKLLLLHHEHPPRIAKQRNYDREEDTDFADSCSSLQADSDWWWEFLHHLRENALVSIANIAGHVDLGLYPEDISRPILDGLLHWAVCPAAQGQDPFPTVSPTSSLSPQRLALEALCKLCVTDSNVDLVIATPPYCRLERLAGVLTRLLCRSEEQVLREFAVNLLYYLGAADSGMARTIALQPACVSQLVAFIEEAETKALGVANTHGLSALRDNPDCMGTSLDMLRRAARTLLHLSQHPENRTLFLQQEQRLLALVMSQILDQQVASVISMVLFHVSRSQSPPAPEAAAS
ncbi:trithorax group protein osa isoform X9 [Halyomorpha halys]|uniref:trithorax group protein osa isoform X9 n=1 Tax=Halyomorpha halys TaxID=286706 RepID=UPI0034D28799